MCILNNHSHSYSHSVQTNTYQALIITDGVQSYTVFTYNCQLMEWTGLFRHATVGHNAGGEDFFNHELSGSPQINTIACQNRQRNVDWSNLVYRLQSVEVTSPLQVLQSECNQQFRQDRQLFGAQQPLPRRIRLATIFSLPCPCNYFQAIRDRRYQFFFNANTPGESFCFVQIFRTPFGSQICCYSILTQ